MHITSLDYRVYSIPLRSIAKRWAACRASIVFWVNWLVFISQTSFIGNDNGFLSISSEPVQVLLRARRLDILAGSRALCGSIIFISTLSVRLLIL